MTTVEYLWPFIKDEFASKDAALAEYRQWVAIRCGLAKVWRSTAVPSPRG
jgi:hypothetical protein